MKLLGVIKDFLIGAVIGIANIIPGVSGGTMMVILGVFDRIVDAVGNFFKSVKKNILFLLPILLGAAAGILAFSKGITFMLENYPIVTNFFFIGLILGSVPFVFRQAFRKSGGKPSFRSIRPGSFAAFVLAFALLVVIFFCAPGESSADSAAFQTDFGTMLWFFFGGAVAAVAMIVPGLSGSFVMVLFGIYPVVAGALAVLLPFEWETFLHRILPVGLPIGLGIIVGLLAGAKLIDLLIRRFPQETYFGILGLLFGSLPSIYPGFSFDGQGIAAVAALAFGFALAFFSGSDWLKNKFAKSRDNTLQNEEDLL